MLEELPCLLAICDSQGRVKTLSGDAERYVGIATFERLVMDRVVRALAACGGASEEFVVHGDGSQGPRSYLASCRRIRTNGVDEGDIAVVLQDVTDRERLGSERDRLLRLAAVSETLPTVLHEIRNPLAAIQAMAEVLTEDADSASVRDDLYALLREVRRIQLILQGIGSFGRSLRSANYGAIDFAVQEVGRTLQPIAQEAGVRLVVDAETMPLLPFDPAVIRGMVFNLVRNSLDACSPGDEVRLACGLDDQGLVLRVEDSGSGMPPEILKKASTLFYSTKRHGSGIGLAIVRRSVEEAGGRFVLESQFNQGTSVVLVVPITPINP